LKYGISPRWWLALISWAKVLAVMNSRTFVIPEDIKKISKKVLWHRIVLNYEAIADDVNIDDIIDNIMWWVKVV
jgi:MoxR-like ATPase